MAIDLSQFHQVFFEESAEHLDTLEHLLLALDIETPDAEQLNAIFRAAHSIKGSAATFGFADLAETTHLLENLLDRIRKRDLALRRDMVDAFLQCGDLLRAMLESHQGRGQVPVGAVGAMRERLQLLSRDGGRVADPITGGEQHLPSDGAIYDIQFVPTAVSADGNGVANLLDELREFGTLEILQQPAEGQHPVGFWHLRLSTAADAAAFSDQIDLIAENGAWRVVAERPSDEAAFGFFDDLPATAGDEDSYGFFEPLAHAPSPPADDAYGFFDPLPAEQSADNAGGEAEAYGFFTPLPEQCVVLPGASGVLEEGDGFGFFAPIQLPPIEPVAVHGGSPAAGPAVASVAPASGGRKDTSIRVGVEKVDQLINLVGELVITQAMLLQTAAGMQESAPERLLNGLTLLERNTRDLQEAVLSIRMMPISSVFSRFPRVVRDLSVKLGKQVELKMSGESTELDKGLVERIVDPLTHLIRNSLDHGIETPASRIAAGKAPAGTITLRASHQGGNIVIEVGDDGAGLPRDKILSKARERGLPVSEQMTDQEVFQLIFEAGFSTAEQVTDVSGRGVGMDVVRRNIQQMGGRVEIESMLGVGTRMTVRLPLTLAILDGMSVAVGNQTYIVPLSCVVESFQPQAGDIRTVNNEARVIGVRGEFLPVLALSDLFKLTPCCDDPTQGIMVVIDADGNKAALVVDALLGQHQVVIKSLEANYRRVPGISGATIMGDGQVALILDAPAIAALARTTLPPAGLDEV